MDIANSPLLSKELPCENLADLTFSDPWEARVFSIIVSLSQAGHFTWGEWVETFAGEVVAAATAHVLKTPVRAPLVRA